MAWLSRTRCTLSEASCAVLLKAHVSGLDDGAFLPDDPEQLLVRYAGFLAAAAGQTVRLNSSVVEKAAVTVFGVSGATAHRFGQSMTQAMAYAYGKGCKATSGRKLSDAVKTVCLGFRCEAMEPLQRALASPSRLGAVKQEASGSQQPEPELSLVASPSASSGMTNRDIAALYGVSPVQEPPTAGPVEIVSSPEAPSQDLHPAAEGQDADPVPNQPKRRKMRGKGEDSAFSLPAFVNQEGGAAFPLDHAELRMTGSIWAQWSDLAAGLHFVMAPNGTIHETTLQDGPNGFCVAAHEFWSITTDIPNLHLPFWGPEGPGGVKRDPPKKGRASASAGAAVGDDTPEGAAAPASLPAAPAASPVAPAPGAAAPPGTAAGKETDDAAQDYQVLYYKKTNIIGIREKHGLKRQVFGFGGKRCQKTREEFVALGLEVVSLLVGGEMTVDEAKAWARGRAGQE